VRTFSPFPPSVAGVDACYALERLMDPNPVLLLARDLIPTLMVGRAFIAFLGFPRRSSKKEERREASPLDAVASAIGGASPTRHWGGWKVEGVSHGRAVTFEVLEDEGAGPGCTVLQVELPATSFLLELRRPWPSEKMLVRCDGAFEVKLGDAEFDEQWVIEGAP